MKAVSRSVLSNRICILLLHGQADGGGLLKRAAGSGDGDRIRLRSGTEIASAASADGQYGQDRQSSQAQEHPSTTCPAEPAEAAGKSQQRDAGKNSQQRHGTWPLRLGS